MNKNGICFFWFLHLFLLFAFSREHNMNIEMPSENDGKKIRFLGSGRWILCKLNRLISICWRRKVKIFLFFLDDRQTKTDKLFKFAKNYKIKKIYDVFSFQILMLNKSFFFLCQDLHFDGTFQSSFEKHHQ